MKFYNLLNLISDKMNNSTENPLDPISIYILTIQSPAYTLSPYFSAWWTFWPRWPLFSAWFSSKLAPKLCESISPVSWSSRRYRFCWIVLLICFVYIIWSPGHQRPWRHTRYHCFKYDLSYIFVLDDNFCCKPEIIFSINVFQLTPGLCATFFGVAVSVNRFVRVCNLKAVNSHLTTSKIHYLVSGRYCFLVMLIN